jgi:hypothetical protein
MLFRKAKEYIIIGFPEFHIVLIFHKWEGVGKSRHWLEDYSYWAKGYTFGFVSLLNFNGRF